MPLNMVQMAFTQEQVTVQVYTVYSIVTCYYSGHSEAKSECEAEDLSLIFVRKVLRGVFRFTIRSI